MRERALFSYKIEKSYFTSHLFVTFGKFFNFKETNIYFNRSQGFFFAENNTFETTKHEPSKFLIIYMFNSSKKYILFYSNRKYNLFHSSKKYI